ncbi:DNA-binding response regulator [Caldimonas sp.]|uniref:DNA-binding response regulator n=1 Tax=Caldimonas sp. TaxID=2838790 RepID=UPI00307DF2D3
MNPVFPDLDPTSAVVLVVDDVPDNVAMLHDALDESGYTVLVATHGEGALRSAAQAQPDIVLLDAVMPGMDGFEVARRLKSQAATASIPIIFMTGLSDTEHVVAAFQAGGVDYVTKPVRTREVIARIATHVQGARQARQAKQALDVFGNATLAVRLADGRITWQTPLARQYLETYGGSEDGHLEPGLTEWLRQQAEQVLVTHEPASRTLVRGAGRLTLVLHHPSGDGEWFLVLREANDAALLEALSATFRLTAREAEVLYWVVQGKTNRDIGDILGASPATVKKHLEHVFEKLGVETRTAAAAVAIGRVPLLGRR